MTIPLKAKTFIGNKNKNTQKKNLRKLNHLKKYMRKIYKLRLSNNKSRIFIFFVNYIIERRNMNNIDKIRNDFKRITRKRWIKGVGKGPGNIGLTFEHELGIPKNELEIPDYHGIEIKTKRTTSTSNICLFNATFDGKYLFETKRIVKKYGWPDKIVRKSNVLHTKVNGKILNSVGIKWKMKIKVDYKEQKVFLEIYDRYNHFIENECFWSFNLLEEKLLRKDKMIALIQADQKIINDEKYFHYHTLTIYELKDFNTFLKLLNQGYIKVGIKLGVFRHGNRYGDLHDHGTSFEISIQDIDKLYKKLN